MTFGVRAFNEAGEAAIDSLSLNYTYAETGSANWTAGTGVAYGPVISFAAPIASDAPPLIAAQWGANDNLYCMGVKILGSPGSWTGFQLSMVSLASSVSISVTWRAYASGLTSSAGYGARAFVAGQVAFDSGLPPMEISAYLNPSAWVGVSNTTPAAGVRRMVFAQGNPASGGMMVLSTHRFGDLAYPGGVEGASPVALVAYGYGYGASNQLRLFLIMQTYTSTTTSALSTPNAYISAIVQ